MSEDEPYVVDGVAIDSGTLLLVDPCHIPAEVLAAILTPNDHGVTAGFTVWTPGGDGWILGDSVLLDDGTAVLILYPPNEAGGAWRDANARVLELAQGAWSE